MEVIALAHDDKKMEKFHVYKFTLKALSTLDTKLDQDAVNQNINGKDFKKESLLKFISNEELLIEFIKRNWIDYKVVISAGKYSREFSTQFNFYLRDFDKNPKARNFDPDAREKYMEEDDLKKLCNSDLVNYIMKEKVKYGDKYKTWTRGDLEKTGRNKLISNAEEVFNAHENLVRAFKPKKFTEKVKETGITKAEILKLFSGQELFEVLKSNNIIDFSENRQKLIYLTQKVNDSLSIQSIQADFQIKSMDFLKKLVSRSMAETHLRSYLKETNNIDKSDEQAMLDHASFVCSLSPKEALETILRKEKEGNPVFKVGDKITYLVKDTKARKYIISADAEIERIVLETLDNIPAVQISYLSDKPYTSKDRTCTEIKQADGTTVYKITEFTELHKLYPFNPLNG